MKKNVLSILVSLFVITLCFGAAWAEEKVPDDLSECILPLAAGGPDDFGYRYIDSTEPGGPVYNWTEVAPPMGGTGTSVGIDCDDCYAGPFPIGFTFNFYGTDYTDFYVSSNGTVYFMNAYLGLGNVCGLPTGNGYGVNTFIAPFWDDLTVYSANGSQIYYGVQGTPGSRRLVIEYYHVDGFGCSGGDNSTFEIVLNEGSNNVLMQYQDTTNGCRDNGSQATIGIQGTDLTPPTWGLEYSCNASSLSSGLAILFQKQPDLIVSYLPTATAGKVGGLIRRLSVKYRVMNQGTANASASELDFYLSRDTALNAGDVYVGTVNIPALAPGVQAPLPYGVANFLLPTPASAIGAWKVLGVADANNDNAESDETNNVLSTGAVVMNK